jgi:hypothetical protein
MHPRGGTKDRLGRTLGFDNHIIKGASGSPDDYSDLHEKYMKILVLMTTQYHPMFTLVNRNLKSALDGGKPGFDNI